jgi:hypothetical protein
MPAVGDAAHVRPVGRAEGDQGVLGFVLILAATIPFRRHWWVALSRRIRPSQRG